ncbi:MAG TPA: chemotaxis protein CheW [Acidimicrobiales bacterium]|nr:chemotaxis protein CheW [Acidimicrobiales bacterium]
MQALLLPVGPEWYAVDTAWAREVVAVPLVVPLPTAPSTVLGVFNLRGEIVPLFDAGALLGVGGSGDHPYAVVVDTALGLAALAAHAVPEVVDLGEQTGTADLPGALTTHTVGRRLAVLLDISAVLAPVRIGGRP